MIRWARHWSNKPWTPIAPKPTLTDGYEQLELFKNEEMGMGREMNRSEKPEMFAKGGSNKMFERGTAHEAVPGQSGKSSNGGEDGVTATKLEGSESYVDGFKMAEGGSDHMFGKGHAGKKQPGVSGKESQEG